MICTAGAWADLHSNKCRLRRGRALPTVTVFVHVKEVQMDTLRDVRALDAPMGA